MKLNRIASAIDRVGRNDINENFDILERGYGKAAIDAQTAKTLSEQAKQVADNIDGKATQALKNSNDSVITSDDAMNLAESVQEQFNQVVIEGDSSVEAAQARVDTEKIAHSTLKERIDNDVIKINQKIGEEIDIVTQQIKTYFNFLDAFREPILSKELFTLPTGMNEFSLIYVDGLYHLFYDDKQQSKHRKSATIDGLKNAIDDVTVDGRYPWLYHENGTWHLWVRDNSTLTSKHYTAQNPEGLYTYSDDCLVNKSDWKVFKNPYNNKYYATYKDVSTGFAGVAVSDNLNGLWNDLGYVFSDESRSYWHSYEEADSTLVFDSGKVYLLFAGWDLIEQRIGVVELDVTTFKAINSSVVMVSPEETWHLRNGMRKVFSPVYLQNRIYYAQNPSDAVEAGWGYIEPTNPITIRRKNDVVRADFKIKKNNAVNLVMNLHGTPTLNEHGLTVDIDGIGGVYGSLASSILNDFTLQIEFTVNQMPNGYARLFTASETTEDGSIVGVWLNGQNLHFEILERDHTERVVFSDPVTLDANTKYRVSVRRYDDEVIFTLNGAILHSANYSAPITNLKEYSIANQKGNERVEGQQFIGTIHSAVLLGEAMSKQLL